VWNTEIVILTSKFTLSEVIFMIMIKIMLPIFIGN